MRVLVVEDEEIVATSLQRGLDRRGFVVDLAGDGMSGLEKAQSNHYEVIVLDRDLPRLHGDDVCRRLLDEGTSARILMLTASSGLRDRVSGLNLGADDYLAKPFEFEELVARVQALCRRPPAPARLILERGGIELDTETMVARRNGSRLDLTASERRVLAALLRADGAVVSAEELIEQCWDEHLDPMSNVVAVTIGRVRRKLGEPAIIETVPGAGYRL